MYLATDNAETRCVLADAYPTRVCTLSPISLPPTPGCFRQRRHTPVADAAVDLRVRAAAPDSRERGATPSQTSSHTCGPPRAAAAATVSVMATPTRGAAGRLPRIGGRDDHEAWLSGMPRTDLSSWLFVTTHVEAVPLPDPKPHIPQDPKSGREESGNNSGARLSGRAAIRRDPRLPVKVVWPVSLAHVRDTETRATSARLGARAASTLYTIHRTVHSAGRTRR